MVKVTLKTTLTANQNKHPLPPKPEPSSVHLRLVREVSWFVPGWRVA